MKTNRILLAATCFASLAVPALAQDSAKAKNKADSLFGIDKIWTFHIKITAEDWEKMQPKGGPKFGFAGPGFGKEKLKDDKPADKDVKASKFGLEFTYVKGTLDALDKTYPDVGVRFKGNSSYMASARGIKRPFKIDFNRYIEDQKFLGLTMISLGNNAMDPSQLREALAYHAFREAGIPAGRTAFVKLHLSVPGKYNNEYLGLYTLIEAVNKPFLQDRFGSKKGLLLKPEKVQGLPYLGEKFDAYKDRFQPKTDPTDAQAKRFIEFVKLINQADDDAFRKQIASYMDMDEFLRFLAVHVLTSNLDSFLGLGHNYYLYLHPKTNKIVWIPWDLNMAFGGFPMAGGANNQIDWSIKKPYMGKHRLIERVLAIAEYENAYREHLRKLSTGPLSAEKLTAAFETMNRTIKEAVDAEAKLKAPAAFPFKGPPMPFQNMDLKTFAVKRVEAVIAQLDGKSKGVEISGMFGPGGPGGKFGPPMPFAKPAFDIADANHDGKLTLDEARAAAKTLFEKCDKANKGVLDEKGLAAGLNALLPPPPGFGPRPGGAGNPGPGGKPPIPFGFNFGPGNGIARAILKTASAKDNQLTLKEMTAAAETLFAQWDKNKDGTLSEQEFTEGLGRLMGPLGMFPGPPGGPGGPPQPKEK